jgi:hypothetical protein
VNDFDKKKHVFEKAHIHWLLREENLKMLNKNVIVDLTNTDWKLLRKQKKTLLEILDSSIFDVYTGKEQLKIDEHLAGLIHFLDDIQDQTAKQLGEKKVFGVLK